LYIKMIKYKFIVLHACILLVCVVFFFLVMHKVPHLLNFNLGMLSIMFMSFVHIVSGLLMLKFYFGNGKKHIFAAIATHSVKFIAVVSFVFVLLSIEKNNFALGILLASLFLLYMISEIILLL